MADLSLSTSFGQHLLHACFTVRLRMTPIRRDPACEDDHGGEVCRHLLQIQEMAEDIWKEARQERRSTGDA